MYLHLYNIYIIVNNTITAMYYMIIAKQPKMGFSGFCDLVPSEEQPIGEKQSQENLNLLKDIVMV